MLGIHPKDIRLARRILERLYDTDRRVFKTLFLNGQCAVISGNVDGRVLQHLGLVIRDGRWYRSDYVISYIQGNFIVTDPPSLKEIDRVFPLFEDESVFLTNKLSINDGEVGLDIGTGSGICAVVAAKKAKHVIATDINSKVGDYVRFNAVLNGVHDRIEFVYSDVYAGLNGEKFDFIVSNPPFVPVPREASFYIHSAGGEDGLEIVRRVLFDCSLHLKRDGNLQMLAMSLGRNLRPMLMTELEDQSAWRGGSVKYRFLYDASLRNLSAFLNRFESQINFQQWKNHLTKSCFTDLHYLYLRYSNTQSYGIALDMADEKFSRTLYSGAWEARLNRYVMPETQRSLTASATST